MPKVTIFFGLLLIGLGLYGYYGGPDDAASGAGDSAAQGSEETGGKAASNEGGQSKKSVTALIPAFIGVPLLLCGFVALGGGKARKHAMHVGAMLGVLGTLAAGGRGLSKIGALMSNDPELNRRAVYLVLIMAAICAVYTVLCVQSFIAARKAREAKEQGESA